MTDFKLLEINNNEYNLTWSPIWVLIINPQGHQAPPNALCTVPKYHWSCLRVAMEITSNVNMNIIITDGRTACFMWYGQIKLGSERNAELILYDSSKLNLKCKSDVCRLLCFVYLQWIGLHKGNVLHKFLYTTQDKLIEAMLVTLCSKLHYKRLIYHVTVLSVRVWQILIKTQWDQNWIKSTLIK